MAQDLKDTFWKRLDNVTAGLLSTDSERPVPMAPQADRGENAIWFITAAGSAADRASQSGGEARFDVADPKAGLYAVIEGKLDHGSGDKLDDVWNAFAAAWLKDGRDDDSVRLVKMTPHKAEVWATENSASFLWEVAKSNLTDATPEGGEHGRLAF
ncbi:pyridoxamine 5'-phosphate oxidase family protein [Roseivivax isoporae]|uniref:General stress protein n=1 Tax=Roseivivax isoporae LMG 25204 TaxID=1449351 RepID=X7F9S0_9RHOB|nr:pyridoxamine 5'-phosphate oxidase family protein [Roseivivax isoporae]ETX29458.1 general stress protein [Roseivivax isoporae LMG 25204]